MKFIMLINVKMPTIVGILTFISMINTTSKSLKARNGFIFQHFIFYERVEHEKNFITSEPEHQLICKQFGSRDSVPKLCWA